MATVNKEGEEVVPVLASEIMEWMQHLAQQQRQAQQMTNLLTALVRRNGGQIVVKKAELGDAIANCVFNAASDEETGDVTLIVRREAAPALAPSQNGL